MNTTLNKRAVAYLFDLIIIIVIISLVSVIYYPDISFLNNKLDDVGLGYLNKDMSFSDYFKETSSIYKEIDKTNIFINFINILIIIIYFVVVPFFNSGQTLGKKFMHIKVKMKSNTKLSIISLFIRNLLINGLLYLIMVVIGSLIVPGNYYFIFITVFGIVQIVLLLVSMIMVLYRKDRRGLHDIFASTRVSNCR